MGWRNHSRWSVLLATAAVSSSLLGTAACGRESGGDSWTEVDVAEADGVSFNDVSVTGDRAIAVGSRDGERGAALVIDGDAWTAFDTADLPPLGHVFAAAPDDVWAGADGDDEGAVARLWHWDGTDWAPVELPAAIRVVHDVWGTGPADVWIAAQFEGPAADGAGAYHWDGSVLTAQRDFFDMLGVDEDTTTPLSMRTGCSPTAGDVWLAGGLWLNPDGFGNAAGFSFHFDGEVWRVHEMLGMPRDLACLETEMWYLGQADTDHVVGRWQGGTWAAQDSLPVKEEHSARLASVRAAAGAFWVVGDEGQAGDAASPQVWRLADGAAVRAIGEWDSREAPDRPLLRALYETPGGTIRALGARGLVLDHAGDW